MGTIIDRNAVTLKSFVLDFIKLEDVKLHSLLHGGNKKVPKTTAIFNMGSAFSCPSLKLGLCQAYKGGKHICYAQKAEYMYKEVLPYRNKQESFWKNCSAEEFVKQFVIINTLKVNTYNKLRFNESGDFWGQECVDKVERIASLLSKYNIKVYMYTSRKDLDFSCIKHAIINGTNFQKVGVKNIVAIVKDKDSKPKGYSLCKGDCNICDRCSIRGSKIAIPVH